MHRDQGHPGERQRAKKRRQIICRIIAVKGIVVVSPNKAEGSAKIELRQTILRSP